MLNKCTRYVYSLLTKDYVTDKTGKDAAGW